MTDTNPYGNDGFFSRVFGIDPNKIDYTNNLGPRGIENVKRQAYDRFLNPFAQVDAFGRPTMGANAALGITRSGVQPGDLTRYGPAVQSQREGIAGLFENTMLGSVMPKQARIPGYDSNVLLPDLMAGPAVGGGTEPPGIPYFTSSTNLPLALDAPSMEDIKAARGAGERSFGEVDFDTERRATDEDSPVSRGTVPESTYRPIFTDDMPTVSEVILGDLQGPPAFIETGRSPVRSVSRSGQPLEEVTGRLDYPGTANDRDAQGLVVAGTMRSPRNVAPSDNQRYVTVDGRIYDRQLDKFLPGAPPVQQNIGTGDTGSASITAVGRGPGDVSSDILSPESIADILELPGRDPDAPAPFDMIDALSPSLPPAPPAQPSGSRDIILIMPDGRVIDSRNVGQ